MQMKLSIEKAPQFLTPRLRAKPTPSLEKARIAIVHYWFVNHRGGERVVEAMASMFPQAELSSLVVDAKAVPVSLRERPIKTSFL